jgi:hypothetical protein
MPKVYFSNDDDEPSLDKVNHVQNSTLLHFTFYISPFIGDLLILLHCIDIIVFNSPFDLLLWSLVGH